MQNIQNNTTNKTEKTWFNSLAYDLGRTTKKFFNKTDSMAQTAEKSIRKTMDSLEKQAIKKMEEIQEKKAQSFSNSNFPAAYFKDNNDISLKEKERIMSVLKDISEIIEISGLKKAFEEMKENAREHSEDPILNQFISKLEHLDPVEQENLANKFISRLNANPDFTEMMMLPSLDPVSLTEKDRQAMVDTLTDCLCQSVKDIGMYDGDFEYLQKLTKEISEPLNKCIQLYLDPKTFFQKVKRIWRLQRIGFKSLKILVKTNEFSQTPD